MKNLFIKLLTLDLINKILAYYIAPTNSIFFLTFNRDMVFNLAGNDILKFIFPLMLLPVFLVMGLYLNKEQKNIYFQIVLAGFLGNYICRFLEVGVVDFIVVGNVNANLADIYCWASYLYFAYSALSNLGLIKKQAPQVSK